jgi:hypothetical protein
MSAFKMLFSTRPLRNPDVTINSKLSLSCPTSHTSSMTYVHHDFPRSNMQRTPVTLQPKFWEGVEAGPGLSILRRTIGSL